MGKICPFTKTIVLYLTCVECEDREQCEAKENKQKEKTTDS